MLGSLTTRLPAQHFFATEKKHTTKDPKQNPWEVPTLRFQNSHFMDTFPETNIASENGWLESDRFLLGGLKFPWRRLKSIEIVTRSPEEVTYFCPPEGTNQPSSLYETNPNNALLRDILQVYHTFALKKRSPPKWVPCNDPCQHPNWLPSERRCLYIASKGTIFVPQPRNRKGSVFRGWRQSLQSLVVGPTPTPKICDSQNGFIFPK